MYVRENLLRLCFQCQKFLIGSLRKMMRDDQFRHMILDGGSGVQHLLHLKSKSKILRPIEIMGFFYEIFCQIQENNLL